MKVRKMDEDGDHMFGHCALDFYQDSADGVAQNVLTRLKLWRGEWFLNTNSGTPWLQEILGKHDAVDVVLRTRILETPGVNAITRFETILDPDTRRLTVTAEIATPYGVAAINEVTI